MTTATMTDEITYSSAEVTVAADLTYRELDYWTRTGIVTPSGVAVDRTGDLWPSHDVSHPGSGWQRRWSAHDVDVLRTVKMLTTAGLDLGRIRRALRSGTLGALKADLEQAFAEADRVGLCG